MSEATEITKLFEKLREKDEETFIKVRNYLEIKSKLEKTEN